MKTTVVDMVERAGWTFAQAFVGSLVGINFVSGSTDWREVFVSALVAGLVAVLKVLGVTAAQVRSAQKAADVVAEEVPVIHKLAETPVGQTTDDIARHVALELVGSLPAEK